MLEDFINTTITGINNPDCAFFVGSMMGQMTLSYVAIRIAFIYVAFRLLDKFLFVGVPLTWKWVKENKK